MPPDTLSNLPPEQLLAIALFLAVLVLIWLLIRFLLRLSAKVFTAGCVVILLLGLCLVVFQFAVQ